MSAYLVTGGAGFIGSHLVEALVHRGEPVRVLDDLSSGRLENLSGVLEHIEFIQGDVADANVTAGAVQGVDCVFHLAALASVPASVERPLDCHAACTTGTIVLLDSARRAGVRRVVFAGSSAVYGERSGGSRREDEVPEPLSPYAAAKAAGEMYCRAFWASYGLETVVLRYFNVFGPRQNPRSQYAAVIPQWITALLEGRRPVIYGDGRQSRDFTSVDNVVHANLLAASSPTAAGRTINIAEGRSFDLLHLLDVLRQVMNVEVEPVFAPPRTGDVRFSRADISLAQQLLGYQPQVDFEEGLRRTVAYYRQDHRRFQG